MTRIDGQTPAGRPAEPGCPERPSAPRTPRRGRLGRAGAGALLLAAAAPLLLAGPASAASRAIRAAFGDGEQVCFARHYDRAHMRAHPQQEVDTIWLARTPATADEEAGTSYDAVLEFGFSLRGQRYSGYAYCRNDSCEVEGDSGSFTLSRAGEGLRLSVGAHLGLEGATDFSPDLARSADDRVFILYRGRPRDCG